MATIKNLELDVVRGKTQNRAKILVKFDVSFTRAERANNLQFGMYAAIYEIDYAEDSILPIPNGYESLSILNLKSAGNKTTNSEDDFITWLTPQVINLGGRTKMNYQLEAEILVKNRNASNETFKAFVYVIPEIFAGFGWSEKVTIPKETVMVSNEKQESVNEVKKATEQKTPQQETKPPIATKPKIVKKTVPGSIKKAQPKA